MRALQRDLPSLACRAAIELDNLILAEAGRLDAVSALGSTLQESLTEVAEPASPSSLLNPTTAIVVNGAISDAKRIEPLGQLDELIGETKNITHAFDELLHDPDAFRKTRLSDLVEMRSFCLALSKRAFGFKRARQRRTRQRPFGR